MLQRLYQEAYTQATGDTSPVIHLIGPRAPPMFCALQSPTPRHGQVLAHACVGGECKTLCMVQIWEKASK